MIPVPRRWHAWRAGIAQRPALNPVYRIMVGVLGVVVLVVGILAIPYPGPGWLIVFAGLGILATEFAWAQQMLHRVRQRYRWLMSWYGSRGPVVRILGVIGTGAVVVVTLWSLGTFGVVGGWIGVEWEWLHSPLTH